MTWSSPMTQDYAPLETVTSGFRATGGSPLGRPAGSPFRPDCASIAKPLPLLNGFPLRLVVPGWYATYWVKMLTEIEVLDQPHENYWTAKAYLIPDMPRANITPDQKDLKMVPINRMVPRSFVTNFKDGAAVQRGQPLNVRGIAFGGDTGLAKVVVSVDAGHRWQEATRDGPRQVQLSSLGDSAAVCQCRSAKAEGQGSQYRWISAA